MLRVLEEVGPTLLHVVCGEIRADEIGGVVIHDPHDESEMPEKALVLAVGTAAGELPALIRELGRHDALAVIVRAPLEPTDELEAAAGEANLAVLTLTRGAGWNHLAGIIRGLSTPLHPENAPATTLTRSGAGQRQVVGYQSGLDDLFALANAVAALIDAPITIEDRNSRLLAFSSRQEHADAWRQQTILRRQVPEAYTRLLEERGVFQKIYRSIQPVFVPPLSLEEADDSVGQGRVAVAVRAGDEILGTIWAVASEPFDDERSEALYEASKLVALQLVWQRADADVERRLRAELLSTALESGPQTIETLHRLGLKDEPSVVLALTVVGPAGETPLPAQLAAERKRVADAFALHLSAVHPRNAAGLVGDVAYAILPATRGTKDAEKRAGLIANEFVGRVNSRLRPLVGVGPIAPNAASLKRSRLGADRALRVLRSRQAGPRVASLDDVHLEALLLELSDRLPKGDLPSGPIARIAAYDRKQQTSLLDTLRAWLDAFGDVIEASAAMYVHPNTFRYRLRRAIEVGQIDQDDPNARLAAMLQLRLMDISIRPEG